MPSIQFLLTLSPPGCFIPQALDRNRPDIGLRFEVDHPHAAFDICVEAPN
jgi:hypothetical protein